MIHESKLMAGWHTFYFEAKEDGKGRWLTVSETRPSGHRSSIVVDHPFMDPFLREVLIAAREMGAAPTVPPSMPRPRNLEEWRADEDTALKFLYSIGSSEGEIASAFQRERTNIRSRLSYLGVER